MVTLTNIPFADNSRFPIVLNDQEIGVKAQVDYENEINEYVLDLNGEAYESLLYLSPTFNPFDIDVKTICATVTINDQVILDGTTQEWQPLAVEDAIYSQLSLNEYVTSIKVDLLSSYIKGAKV